MVEQIGSTKIYDGVPTSDEITRKTKYSIA